MSDHLTEQQLNALFERGNNFIRMGNLVAAIKDYDVVIQHRSDFAPAYFNRGFARQHGVGDIDGAIRDYQQAIALKPNFPEALINCAIAHTQQEDYTEALEDYSAALALNPRLPQAYVNRGEIYFLLGNYAAAAQDFRQAEGLKPGYRYAIAGLAISSHALGELDTALKLWESLLKRNPDFGDPDWVRGELGWHEVLMQAAAQIIAHFG